MSTRSNARIALAALGVALILAPVAFGMFSKAPKGAAMMANFTPFMTTGRLAGFQQEMHTVGAAVTQGDRALAQVGRTAAGHHALAKVAGPFTTFSHQWTAVNADMGGMLTTIQHNLPNYQAVAALPSFRLFPWFFVIPGALVLLLALGGLLRARAWPTLRWVAVALGLALIAAPVGFQMFSRAPKGASMMGTFRTIETTHHLRRIQSYFSEMAAGQGLVQLNLVPALHRAGVPDSRYPALRALDDEWVHILNDMTPMIAAMSNNIANYQAVSSLPSFDLFPWFFVLPGAIVIALALAGEAPLGRGTARRRSAALNPVNQGVA